MSHTRSEFQLACKEGRTDDAGDLLALILQHARRSAVTILSAMNGALQLACEHGHVAVTKLLLDAASDTRLLRVGVRLNPGAVAKFASQRGSGRVEQLLLGAATGCLCFIDVGVGDVCSNDAATEASSLVAARQGLVTTAIRVDVAFFSSAYRRWSVTPHYIIM